MRPEGIRGSGLYEFVSKRYHFSQIFPESRPCSPPDFFLLEPSRAHCLLLFQGTCHFLGCLITIWVLVYPPLEYEHKGRIWFPDSLSPAPGTEWKFKKHPLREIGGSNMWPQFTLAKEHLQEAGWHSHPPHSTGDWHPELFGPALTSRKSLWQNLSFETIMKPATAVMWTLGPTLVR